MITKSIKAQRELPFSNQNCHSSNIIPAVSKLYYQSILEFDTPSHLMNITLTVGLRSKEMTDVLGPVRAKSFVRSFCLSDHSLCTLAETWAVQVCLLWGAVELCGRGHKHLPMSLCQRFDVSQLQIVLSEQPVRSLWACARFPSCEA